MKCAFPILQPVTKAACIVQGTEQKLLSLLDGTFPSHTSGCQSNSGSTEYVGGIRPKVPAIHWTAISLMRVYLVQPHRVGEGEA